MDGALSAQPAVLPLSHVLIWSLDAPRFRIYVPLCAAALGSVSPCC